MHWPTVSCPVRIIYVHAKPQVAVLLIWKCTRPYKGGVISVIYTYIILYVQYIMHCEKNDFTWSFLGEKVAVVITWIFATAATVAYCFSASLPLLWHFAETCEERRSNLATKNKQYLSNLYKYPDKLVLGHKGTCSDTLGEVNSDHFPGFGTFRPVV